MAKQYGISISDAKGTKLEEAFVAKYGISNDEEGNPVETAQELVNRTIKEFCRNVYLSVEVEKARKTVTEIDI